MTWRSCALFAALAFIGFWSASWSVPLFDLDEGAFSQATLEMLDSGQYLTTTLNGEPRYDKPMLTYWLQGAAVQLLGRHEFAFRLHSMLAATLWLWLLFAFVREREPAPEAAWLAAGALALGLVPGLIGHAATADALLNLLIAATLLDLYRYYEAPRRALVLRVFLWMGLGVLTKGPVAILIPALVSLPFFLGQGRGRDWLAGVCDWRGWLVLLAVVLPWIIACWQADGGEWIRHFLLDHNLGRYNSTLQGHGGKPYYYLVALPLIVLPFSALLPGALARGWRGDALDRFCLLWFAAVFLLFSFSKTQLPHYLLYGATPLFILFGRMAHRLPRRGWLLLPGLLFIALLAALPWILPLLPLKPSRPWEAGILREATAAFDHRYFIATALALLLCAAALRLPKPRALLAVGLAQAILVWFGLVPVYAAGQQEPTRQAALIARRLGGEVHTFQSWLPSFSVYRGAATPEGPPPPGGLVFLRADKRDELQAAVAPDRLLPEYVRGGVLLLRRQPFKYDPR